MSYKLFILYYMSPEVSKLIYEAAIKAGDELKGKLPPHPFHPKGRAIKNVMTLRRLKY